MANGYPSSSKGIQVAQFDPATGTVSNSMVISSLRSYGVAFSPDNSKLYGSDNVYPAYRVRQYDLSNFTQAAITASSTVVGSDSTGGNSRYLKLYNDTIYVSGLTGNPHLVDRINNPNLTGAACNYQEYAVSPSSEGVRLIHLWSLQRGGFPLAARYSKIAGAGHYLMPWKQYGLKPDTPGHCRLFRLFMEQQCNRPYPNDYCSRNLLGLVHRFLPLADRYVYCPGKEYIIFPGQRYLTVRFSCNRYPWHLPGRALLISGRMAAPKVPTPQAEPELIG